MSGAPEIPAEPSEVGAAIWGSGRRGLTVGLILNVVASAFESLAVATALPTVVKHIGGIDLYGWAFSGFMLSNLVGISLAGRAADRSGPAQPLLLGAAAFIAGLVIAGTASSMEVVVSGRVVQGFGAGAISSIGYAAVGRAYPTPAQPRMLAFLSSAWVVPGLIGPAAAGVIADRLGWRWVFFSIVPFVLVGVALARGPLARLAPAAEEARETGAGSIGAALALSAGTGFILLGVSAGAGALAVGGIAAGVAIGVPAFVRLVPEGTLRLRAGLPAAIALMGLIGFSFFAAEAYLPLSLSDVRGQPAAFAGLPLTAGTVCWTAGAWLQARVAASAGRHTMAALGLALLGAGIAISASVLSPQAPLVLATIGWGIAGLGMGIAYSTTALVILESAPSERAGEASAALQLSITVGIAIGTGLGGGILAAIASAGRPLAAGIALIDALTLLIVGFGLFAALRLPRPAVVKPSPSGP